MSAVSALAAINELRTRAGLAALEPAGPRLTGMASGEAAYSHQGASTAYDSYAQWGEVIAWNQPGVSGQRMIGFWMASPPHKANLLRRDVTHVAFAQATSRAGKQFWVGALVA